MTSIFTRMKETIKKDWQGMQSEYQETNPLKSLQHFLQSGEQEADKVKALIAKQYAIKEEFTEELQQADAMIQKRSEQLVVAEEAEDEELIAYAEKDLHAYQERAERLKHGEEEAIKQIRHLERKLEEMNHKLADMRIRQMELNSRENVSRAESYMRQATEQREASFLPADQPSDTEQTPQLKLADQTFDQRILLLKNQQQKDN
ncbi:PspA/IM30 family protein [Paenalkalicoccus suaedae]|uniref:PspA/IM30 family protein n=1 Tax=Paenalkalicoccus suaedae TaxID=2592382 RepID=A0A859FGB8_9BACI|nr:PspA/IM30 family protein [Paenalkalicoccus suaedae]QKS71868.1 PspA/IM30 family protein [Paenalkalicoccus suaedae]